MLRRRALRRIRDAAVFVAALSSTIAPLAAHAAPAPEPIEGELFDSWIGRYQDMTVADLLKHLAVPPLQTDAQAKLPFSPAKTEYYDRVVKALKLGPAAKAQLEKSGLALVTDRRKFSMAAAYYELYTKDLPLLVTTDSILDAMHRSFDAVLADLEETVLRKALEGALRKVQLALPKVAKNQVELKEAATDLDLYLTIALNLLEADPDNGRLLTAPRLSDPKETEAILKKVVSLALENPNVGTDMTTLYGSRRAVDWSQFKPRGHYTKTPLLQRYFRTLMWLGRADTGFELEKSRQLLAAALFTQTLEHTGAGKQLQVMKDVVDLMVGRSDDLTPAQFADVLQREKLTSPADLVPAKNLTRIAEVLAATGLGQQRIRSQFVSSDPSSPVKALLPPVFQPFGQRFVLDSFVLSKVVYDDIIFRGAKQERHMPTGLDVMAALGNQLAVSLLAAPKGELEQWNYAANIAAVHDVVAAWTDASWNDNLYSLWLDVLRTLSHTPAGKHVPAVMQRDPWAAKTLQTQLASWAQLRHDTILYAKQSYTMSLGCLYPEGYVEPYPEFYAKLGRFSAEAARRFEALAGPDLPAAKIAVYSSYFKSFSKTMGTLEGIAKNELAGKELSGKQEDFLKNTIERQMVSDGYVGTPDWSGWYVDLVFLKSGDEADAIDWKPTIADVHTDPDTMRALEVGTGNVDFAVVAIDNDGDRAIHVGPTFSYYEFTMPTDKRLTDEEWSLMVDDKSLPSRPAWILPLVVLP